MFSLRLSRLVLAGLVPLVVSAANRQWSGASSSSFELPANWTGATVPVNDLTTDIAVFSGNVTANRPQLTANRSITGLSFTTASGAWSLSGNSTVAPVLTLGASGLSTTGQTSGNNTVSAHLALGAAQTWSAGTGGTLLVTGNVSSSTGLPLTINSAGNLGTVTLSPATGNSVNLTGGSSSAMFLQVRTGGLLALGGDGVSTPATASVNTILNNGTYGSLAITGNGSVRVNSGTWNFGDFGRNGSADFFSGSLDARGGVIAFTGARFLGAGNLTLNGGTVRVTNIGSIYTNGGKCAFGSGGTTGNATLTLNSGLLDLAQANGTVGLGNSLGTAINSRALQLGGVFQNGLTVGGGTNGGNVTSFNIGHAGLTSANSGANLTYTAVSNILASYTLSGGTFLSPGPVMGTPPASPGTNGSTATPPNVVVNPGTGNVRNFNFTGGTLAIGAFTAANLGYASATGLAGGSPHSDPVANSVGLGTLFNHGGILAPGGVGIAGNTSLTGNYTVASPSASLAIDLGGASPATAFQHPAPAAFHDVFAVSGTTTLAGNLTVNLLPGFTPSVGDSFTVLVSTGTLSGAFANVPFGGAFFSGDGVTAFSVNQVGNSVQLTRVATVAPAIVTSPTSQSVAAGATVTLTVAASGTAPTFQWRKNGVAIPAATSASYTIPAAQVADAGLYDVVVTNPAGSATSTPVRLAVAPAWSSPAAFIYDLNSAAPAVNGTVPDSAARTVGTFIGSPSPTLVAGPNAASGNAWDFTSSGSFIRVASNPVVQSLGDITATSGLSVGFWINYTWLSNAQNNLRVLGLANCIDVLTADSSGNGRLDFRFGNDVNIPQFTLASPRVLDGAWHHLVATVDFTRSTANAKLYLDGALVVTQSQPIQASFTGGTSNFILGARNSSSSSANNPLKGRLDQFAVFTRALDVTEVAQLYTAASVANYAPTVTAAASATTVVSPSNQTTLVATATDDGQPAPAALTLAWTKLSGPGTVTFATPSALVTDATFSALGSYVLRFTASDGTLSSSADVTVNVVTNAAPSVFVSTPTPLVGPTPAAVALSGAATDDGLPGVSPLTYLWTQVSGPGTATFTTPAAASTSVNLPAGLTGAYVFQLAASDGALSGTAQLTVTVSANLAPTVHADSVKPAFSWSAGGANSTPVVAQSSDDGLPAVPGALTHAWTLVSGPGSATFANPAAASTTVTVGAPGVYRLRVTVSDGALSTSDDIWLNAIAANPAIPVPNGVVVRSANPPPYEHPRIFFTDADHATLRTSALTDSVASAGRAALIANLAATLDNPATALGAAYLQLKAGNTAFNTQALTQAQSSPGDAMRGTTGLYGVLAGASYVAWLDRDTAAARLRELATAVATAARNHATWWPADRAAQPTPTDFNKDTYSDLGFCYDVLYDWMTEDQRSAVRSLLASQTAGRTTLGATEPDYSLSTNWRTYHDHIILAALAIEGETGHDATALATNRQALKTFFTQWGVGPEGFNREGPGYFGFGTHSASLALYALSRRGEDLLATTRFYQSAQEMFYMMAPDGSGRMYGANDGAGWGNGNGNAALYAIYKAAYPDDAFIDWVTRQALAPANSVIAASQPLTMAIWGRAPLAGNTSFAATTTSQPRPLHLFSAQRGLGVARSDWSDSALQVDFENRFDAFALGHSHAVRNHFTLFALGREWIGGQGYHYIANDLKSTVLIDGLGQSSASLQALAAAGKPAVISWPPLPGKFLENLDHPLLSLFSGDAKPAYTYSWANQSYAYNPGDVPAGSIQTPYRWKDLAYPGFVLPTPNTGDNAWADTYIRAEPTPFNPVDRAFRSVLTLRGSKPYVLVLDDIQKDSAARTYTWSANTVTNYNVIDMALQPGATPTEAVLYHTTTDTASGPRLLVRVLEGQGTAATPIALDDTPLDFGEGPTPSRRIQISRTAVVAPDFKVLLYPHQSGEALPTTSYVRATGVLTITLPDGTTDVFQLVVQPGGRTRVASFTRNGATPPTLVAPVAVNAPLNFPATSTPVTFALSATSSGGTTLTPVANPPSGSTFPLGTTPVVVSVSDAAGNTSTSTFDVTVAYTATSAPAAPTNLVVTASVVSNLLSWNASSGATSYTVKRSLSPGGPYSIVASDLTGTNYVDTGLVSGTSYYYVVTATNSFAESAASAENLGTPLATAFTKANNTTALDQASSWSPAGVPTALDSVSWNGTYASGIVSIGAGLNISRVQILAPSTSVTVTAGTGPLTLGSGGFDLSAATQSLSVNAPVVLSANQTWALAASRVLNLNGAISEDIPGRSLTLPGSGSIVFSATNTFTGPLTLSGGTLHIGASAGGLTGTLGAGNFTLSGGTLRSNRTDPTTPVTGRFTATAGTLQLNQATGILTLNSTNLPASSNNTLTTVTGVSGATLIVDAHPTANLTFASSLAGLNFTLRNGNTFLTSNQPATNLRIEGGSFTSAATDRFQLATANQSFAITGGTANFTAGVTFGFRVGGSGSATQNGTQTVTATQSGGNVTATTLSLGGLDASATKSPSYTLSGGSLTLTGNGSTALQIGADTAGLGTSTFALSGGKLVVPGTLSGAQSGAKQVFAFTGGTLAAATANATNLRSAATDPANGTFAQSGGILAPGDLGTAGRTVITGAYQLGASATLAIDLRGATQATAFQTGSYDLVTVSGTTSLAGNLSVTLGAGFTPAGNATFTVLSSTGALTGAFANVAFGARVTATGYEGSFLVSQVGNTVVLGGFLPLTAPSITGSSSPAQFALGDSAVLGISTSSLAPVTYAWTKNGAPIPGATSSALTFIGLAESDAGTYQVVATNVAGSIAQSFTVAFTVPVSTASTVIDAGATQSFTAAATATSYQWFLDSDIVGTARTFAYTPTNKAVGTHWLRVVETYASGSPVTRTWSVRVRIPTPVSAIFYHVSPSGSDSAAGTVGAPFLTLEKARDTIRLLSAGQRAGGVTVYLRGGVHRRTTTFTLSSEDSGTASAPIVYAAYPGETPLLTSTRVISSAQIAPLAASEYARVAPGVSTSRIWEIDVTGNARAAAFPNVINEWTIFNAFRSSMNGGLLELFYQGERKKISRYPNENATDDRLTPNILMDGVAPGTSVVKNSTGTYVTTTNSYLNFAGTYFHSDGSQRAVGGAFYYPLAEASRVARWSTAMNAGGLWLQGFWRVPWQINGAKVSFIDSTNRVFGFTTATNTNDPLVTGGIGDKYTRTANPTLGLGVGSKKEPWWVVNLLEEMDVPGEWAVDFARRKLYFLMGTDGAPADADLEFSDVSVPLFQLNGASDIRLDGLTFRRHLGVNVQILNGARNLVRGCTFSQAGNMAVDINGGTDLGVLSSDFEKLASGGVMLRGGSVTIPGGSTTPSSVTPSNHFAVNNRFRSFGEVVRVYQAAIDVGFGGPLGSWSVSPAVAGMRIASNYISTSPHAGILWHGYQHVIEYNEITDFTRISQDLGGIYRFGPNQDNNTVIRYNHLYASPLGEGIYNDFDHVRTPIYGNTVNLKTPATAGRGYGIWTNTNTAVGGAVANIPTTLQVYNNISVNSRSNYSLHSSSGAPIQNNISFRKLSADFAWYRITVNATTSTQTYSNSNATTLSLQPATNIGYTTDPGFIDFANDDLRLRPDAKAYTDLPGFTPIPLELSGLYNDEYRSAARVWTPFIVTGSATSVGANTATFNSTLVYPQFDPNAIVRVYWGPTDGGTDPAAWQNVAILGQPGSGAVSHTRTDLAPATRYYYRFYAVNAAGEDWAEQSNSTTTFPLSAAPAGSASATSAATPAALAFDGLPATAWRTADGSPSGAITYQLSNDAAVLVTRYSVTSAADSPARDPRDWQLLGSYDGLAWVVLDTRSGQSFSARGQTLTFGFVSNSAFKFYRLNVTANNGDATALQLAELAFFTPNLAPDTTGPVITIPGNLTVAGIGSSGAVVNFDVSAVDAVSGNAAATASPPSGTLFPVGITTVTVSASDAAGNQSTTTFTITVTTPSIPAPWSIGQIQPFSGVAPGSVSVLSANSFQITGTGGASTGGTTGDIWTGNSDSFTFFSQPWSGDGTFTARIASFTSTDTSAKAGIMFRETSTTGSRYSMTYFLRRGDAWAQHKTATSGATTNTNFFTASATGRGIPYWIRLVRTGDTFTNFISPDGVTWTQLGTARANPLSGTALTVGLAVGPRTGNTTATATFDNISFVTPLQAWRQLYFGTTSATGDAAGLADPDGDGTVNLFEYAVGTTPTSAASVSSPMLEITGASPEPVLLTLTFTRIADPTLIYRVEAATSLSPSDWTEIWQSTGSANVPGPVTVTDTADLSTGTTPRRFLRLRVTSP